MPEIIRVNRINDNTFQLSLDERYIWTTLPFPYTVEIQGERLVLNSQKEYVVANEHFCLRENGNQPHQANERFKIAHNEGRVVLFRNFSFQYNGVREREVVRCIWNLRNLSIDQIFQVPQLWQDIATGYPSNKRNWECLEITSDAQLLEEIREKLQEINVEQLQQIINLIRDPYYLEREKVKIITQLIESAKTPAQAELVKNLTLNIGGGNLIRGEINTISSLPLLQSDPQSLGTADSSLPGNKIAGLVEKYTKSKSVKIEVGEKEKGYIHLTIEKDGKKIDFEISKKQVKQENDGKIIVVDDGGLSNFINGENVSTLLDELIKKCFEEK